MLITYFIIQIIDILDAIITIQNLTKRKYTT